MESVSSLSFCLVIASLIHHVAAVQDGRDDETGKHVAVVVVVVVVVVDAVVDNDEMDDGDHDYDDDDQV